MKDDIPHFEIDFDENGTITLEAHGYKGDACLKATRELEDRIGGVHERKLKPSFYQRAIGVAKKIAQRNG